MNGETIILLGNGRKRHACFALRTDQRFTECSIAFLFFSRCFPFPRKIVLLEQTEAVTAFLASSADAGSMHFSFQEQEMHASNTSPSLKFGITHVWFPQKGACGSRLQLLFLSLWCE